MKKILLAGLVAFGFALGAAWSAVADDDGYERGERHWSSERKAAPSLAVDNAAYKQECSSCHFLYLPGLLPERSWRRIMETSDKHFGENLALDEDVRKDILSYLTANSSEKTGVKWARTITRSAGDTTPERITEVPWIKKEHRKIKAEVFKRPSIGSFSNCGACHRGAAHGDFEEDSVTIPKD